MVSTLSDDHRDHQSDPAGYLELAEEVFGYVEDEEPEPLTEWYKARCQRQRTEIMEYDITTIVANILIGLGLGIGLVVFWVWRTVRRFEGRVAGLGA
jgi:hypothetical protein